MVIETQKSFFCVFQLLLVIANAMKFLYVTLRLRAWFVALSSPWVFIVDEEYKTETKNNAAWL